MRNVSLFLATIVAASAFTVRTHAQVPKAGSCDDVQWKDERIEKSCITVTERDGKRYVKLSGKVTRKSKDAITVLLDYSNEELTWMPDLGDMVSIDGQETPPMSVAVGQHLRFYVPEAQVTAK